MSMEHKAFLFDHASFAIELQPIIEAALMADDAVTIREFIEQNRSRLTDPYEGEPLGDDWDTLVETADVHDFGDFALTKFYDPQHDIGLGYEWEGLQDIVTRTTSLPYSPILGASLGKGETQFDPGRMGSYFQSGEQVLRSLDAIAVQAGEYRELRRAAEMLDAAASASTGLYVTF